MRSAWLLLALVSGAAQAAWTWGEPEILNTVRGAKTFPHLESANRQGLALSGDQVGVIWEDNRDGTPQCYLAVKPAASAKFQPEQRVSQTECYEPVVVGLGAGRFVAAWEEAGKVHARVWPGGRAIELSDADAGQVALAAGGGKLYAAWAERAGRFRRIVVASLSVESGALRVAHKQPVEAAMPVDEQSYPAIAVAGDGRVTVAWEDRRNRHTVPLVSVSADGRTFAPPARLTDRKSGSADGLGAGTGAMRPTLTRWGARGVAAVWLDKRDFLSGYDVYAALDDGTRRFGRNIQVQDSFGDNMAQWHASAVGNASGRLIAVWDDARDGTPDVWLAEWTGERFADNESVPAASGKGAQSEPVAALDEQGRLHLVWLEGDEQSGTRVRYVRGVSR
ncbi:MAG: hypothetical protein IV085_03000 [Thiobacillus sp.]|nr:hypothetical protein [Thiobacillus sp.]